MLFTDFARTDATPKRWSEPSYRWLDRSARDGVQELRDKLEAWAADYPPEGRADLVGRFQSPDDAHHEGAVFELTLHALLRSIGCSVTLHPAVPGSGSVPDFLVHSPKGHCFYLEATICTDQSAGEAAAQRRLSDLRESLERIDTDQFLFDLRYRGAPQMPIPGRRIRERVERDIAGLNVATIRAGYASEGWDALPHWSFEFEGFSVRLTAMPRRPEKVGEPLERAIGMSSGGARWLATHESIRTALDRKAGRYGELPLPYVIALNVLAEYPPDMIDVWNALLGREALTVGLLEDGTRQEQHHRLPDGFWISKGGPTNTRVSAVLLGAPIRPWQLDGPVHLIHNPWASRPYACELTALPQWTVKEDELVPRGGAGIGALLGLPSGWPELR